jgi:AraC-like DNA-binding protein
MAQPPERIVFATPRVAVGEWRCRSTHPSFVDSGPIERHLVAFPRTSVVIRHVGGEPFVADAGLATLYNRGQRYTREPVHPIGDFCDWWAVDPATAAEIGASVDARVAPDDERPMRFSRAPVDAALYMRQRALLLRLHSGELDELGAEEAVLSIVHAAAAVAADTARVKRPRTTRAAREVADAAARELAASWQERLTLDHLSRRLGVSPFHLCRSFRAVAGRTLHRQLTVLRLRASLEAIAERSLDLTSVALDHGFSSHSHFTAAFRREWGMTPSDWRARLHR